MSYDVQLYRKEVKDNYLIFNDEDFFENEENLIRFTAKQREDLKLRLLKYGYFFEKEDEYGSHFGFNEDPGISAFLTDYALYFSSGGEGIFEISMTSSEFTDTDEFLKYDPQNGGWEEIP
jgi:hypothetical protein